MQAVTYGAEERSFPGMVHYYREELKQWRHYGVALLLLFVVHLILAMGLMMLLSPTFIANPIGTLTDPDSTIWASLWWRLPATILFSFFILAAWSGSIRMLQGEFARLRTVSYRDVAASLQANLIPSMLWWGKILIALALSFVLPWVGAGIWAAWFYDRQWSFVIHPLSDSFTPAKALEYSQRWVRDEPLKAVQLTLIRMIGIILTLAHFWMPGGLIPAIMGGFLLYLTTGAFQSHFVQYYEREQNR